MPLRKGEADERLLELLRQFGRMEEAISGLVNRAAEDRAETKELGIYMRAFGEDIKGAMAGQTQALQSMTSQVVALNSEKCGQRLDAIESKNEHYDRILGTAKTFFWKIAAGVATSALAGGLTAAATIIAAHH